MKARYADWCPRCDQQIQPGEEVVPHKDRYIHARCASGQDDE